MRVRRSVGSGEQDERKRYRDWQRAHESTSDQIEGAKARATTFPYRPPIGVVLSIDGASSEIWAAAALDSVRAQSYDCQQLCIINNKSAIQSVEAMISRCSVEDPRIVVRRARKCNGSTPTAIKHHDLASGEFTIFLDRCGLLNPGAFYEDPRRYSITIAGAGIAGTGLCGERRDLQ